MHLQQFRCWSIYEGKLSLMCGVPHNAIQAFINVMQCLYQLDFKFHIWLVRSVDVTSLAGNSTSRQRKPWNKVKIALSGVVICRPTGKICTDSGLRSTLTERWCASGIFFVPQSDPIFLGHYQSLTQSSQISTSRNPRVSLAGDSGSRGLTWCSACIVLL